MPAHFFRDSPIGKMIMDDDKNQKWKIDLKKALLHELHERQRPMKIAQVQAKAGAENKNMTSCAAEGGGIKEPVGNVSPVPVHLDQMHKHNRRNRNAPQERHFLILAVSALYGQCLHLLSVFFQRPAA